MGSDPAAKIQRQTGTPSAPVRYLYPLTSATIMILLTDTNTRANYRLLDFRSISPSLDLSHVLRHIFRTSYASLAPTSITSSTPPPPFVHHARRYPDADQWAIAHDVELDQPDDQRVIDWLPPQEVPNDCKPISLAMSYKYTRSATGVVDKIKSGCSLCGDLMRPHLHFNPHLTSTYAVDESTIRTYTPWRPHETYLYTICTSSLPLLQSYTTMPDPST